MVIPLRQSTAVTVKIGPFVDDADGKTAETSLSITQSDIRLSKNGGSFAQTNNATGATHDENGYYDVPLDTMDTATLGSLKVAVGFSGALPVWENFQVLDANTYDSLYGGSDKLQVDTVQVGGTAQTARDIGASVLLSPGTGTGQVSLNSGGVTLHTSQPATTFASLTSTGALTVSDGIIVTCTTSNRSAIQATGNGTGHGMLLKSGTGATGSGLYSQSQATNGHGVIGVASGSTGNGIYGYGGTTNGYGIKGQGGDTSGYGIEATSVSGAAIHAQSVSGFGFEIVAGGGNNSAMKLTPAGTGYGINGVVSSVFSLATDAVSAAAVSAAAVTKIQAGLSTLTTGDVPTAAEIDTQLSGSHGAGSWATATGFAVAGDAMALTTSERASVADRFLGRNIDGGGDGTRTVEEALAVLRNKSAISTGTLTVYDTDDTTPLWTATVTSSASADPITGVDPA